jgi:hypothetical protein
VLASIVVQYNKCVEISVSHVRHKCQSVQSLGCEREGESARRTSDVVCWARGGRKLLGVVRTWRKNAPRVKGWCSKYPPIIHTFSNLFPWSTTISSPIGRFPSPPLLFLAQKLLPHPPFLPLPFPLRLASHHRHGIVALIIYRHESTQSTPRRCTIALRSSSRCRSANKRVQYIMKATS